MKRIKNYRNNKQFNTTLINFIYQFKCDKEELMAFTLLTRLLSKTNNKYKDEASFIKERLNRYIINYNVLSQSINDVYFINFSLLIPNTDLINDVDIKSQILYLLDSIYDNNLNDNELFLKEKNLYMESLLNNYKNIDFIAEKNLLDILDNNCIINKMKYKDINNINNLNLNNILDFYNKYIKNIEPTIFVNGNIDIDLLDNVIDEYLKKMEFKKNKVIKKYNAFYDNKLVTNSSKDISKFYQTILYYVYSVDDYKEDDFYKLYLIYLLLNSSSSNLLMNNLRKKSNLVYTTNASVLIRNGLLFIKSMTSKENVTLVKMIITELINDLNNIEKYKNNIKNIINNYKINLEREKDDFYVVSTNIINNYYKTDITLEEEIKILESISLDDIKEILNRFKLIYIYELEGEL